MPQTLRVTRLLPVILTVACCVMGAPAHAASPRTVDEAAAILLARLKPKDKEWILRNPAQVVTAELHLPFGTGVRNEFGLWSGNRPLLASCGTQDAEECSARIFQRLWERVRATADPSLVRALDCQFAYAEAMPIRYGGFYARRMGELMDDLTAQVATSAQATRLSCGEPPVLSIVGEVDRTCWVRAEFSEDGHDPVSLELLLGWLSFRNGFEVQHAPPAIELRFTTPCAWPKWPRWLAPPDAPEPAPSPKPHNNRMKLTSGEYLVGCARRWQDGGARGFIESPLAAYPGVRPTPVVNRDW